MLRWGQIEKLTERRDTLRWEIERGPINMRAWHELAACKRQLDRLVEQWYMEHPNEQDLGGFLEDASPAPR